MLFNSLIFILFLPLVFAGFWLLPARYRNYWLLLGSYYFYFSYNPWYLLLLIGTTVLDYGLALGISNSSTPARKQVLLGFSLLSNLGVLFLFKYLAFFYNSAVSTFGWQSTLMHQLVIPAGLSFYTFQSLSYILDIYRGKYKAHDSLSEFLLYVSFFPHMVAGPIVRYHTLMPQLKRATYFRSIDWPAFSKLCAWGYFKKMVVADNLAGLVDSIFSNPSNYSGFELLLSGFLFAVQVYCDFSGYSDIATGVARLFNIELSLNWQRPFFSKSLREFWQRYHISLTNWFKDYLYVGLGGNRLGLTRRILNILLVFLISGLWHGANFTFLIWGALNGAYYVLELVLGQKFPAVRLPFFLRRILLLSFLGVSFTAFRAASVDDLIKIYGRAFNFESGYWNLNQAFAFRGSFYILTLVFCTIILFLKDYQEEFTPLDRNTGFYKALRAFAYLVFIFLIFVLGNFSANTFIYFQF